MRPYPAELATMHRLADGRCVVIRPIRVCEAGNDGAPRLIGDARYVGNPGGRSCEFGVVVADNWHHTGIAQLLMHALMRAARERGFVTMEGLVLRDNRDMLDFARELGFEVCEAPPQAPPVVRVVKRL